MMKKLTYFLVFVFGIGFASAQDFEITDDDLKAYALANAGVKSITSSISPMVNDLISKQEGMTGQRFKELQATKGDADKLAGIEAQEWEIKFLNTVNEEIEERKTAAKDLINLMAKYAIGSSKYKAIRSGIKSDADLKSRYDAIAAKFE
jgi:hypothetical protein